ncbi:MAG: replication initiation factor domain-containing protein [Oscillospiraceae bacterium]|nr:replication initiation factor domain-containing protein [Oscillospiraceae bacterium]
MKENQKGIGFNGESSKENIFLIDYLAATFRKVYRVSDIFVLIGMHESDFTELPGFYGYAERLHYGGISIHYNGHADNMGVCLEMTGKGCRTFETLGNGDWKKIAQLLIKEQDKTTNITRLDVAYDDHKGVLDIDKIAKNTRKRWYSARAEAWEVTYSSKGTSCYIGSKKSETLIRFYDKAAEQGLDDGSHWVRCELQLRRERAFNFLKEMHEKPVGTVFSGVLNNYLRFVKPSAGDSNKRRWETEEWWEAFVASVEVIQITTKKEIDYNMGKLHSYVIEQAGNCIATYIACVGEDNFKEIMNEKRKLKPHQHEIIRRFRAYRELQGDLDEMRVMADYV